MQRKPSNKLFVAYGHLLFDSHHSIILVIKSHALRINTFDSMVANGWKTTKINDNRSKISITAESREEVDKLFRGLSTDGNIEAPIGNSPWGSYFEMFRDKFGIEWRIDFDSRST